MARTIVRQGIYMEQDMVDGLGGMIPDAESNSLQHLVLLIARTKLHITALMLDKTKSRKFRITERNMQ